MAAFSERAGLAGVAFALRSPGLLGIFGSRISTPFKEGLLYTLRHVPTIQSFVNSISARRSISPAMIKLTFSRSAEVT